MTRCDLTCVHEPFGDAFYYGPERLSERYENDEKGRVDCGFSESTYKTIMDRLDREAQEVRSNPAVDRFSAFHSSNPGKRAFLSLFPSPTVSLHARTIHIARPLCYLLSRFSMKHRLTLCNVRLGRCAAKAKAKIND